MNSRRAFFSFFPGAAIGIATGAAAFKAEPAVPRGKSVALMAVDPNETCVRCNSLLHYYYGGKAICGWCGGPWPR